MCQGNPRESYEVTKKEGRRAQVHLEQKAKNKYRLTGKSPIYDATRLKTQGHRAADKNREKYANVNICTYNVKTLSNEDEVENLLEELGKIE